MDHPRPWLRYIDAGDIEDADIRFDDLDVQSVAGDKLGDVNGFIVDADLGRPHYVVVDSGGWFKSKHFLLPVGHVRYEPSRRVFIADMTRDRVERYPGFDLDEFDELSDEEMDRLDMNMAAICCPTDKVSASATRSDRWSHWQQPDWWKSGYYQSDRTVRRSTTTARPVSSAASRSERDRVVARESEPSPHFDGRAQPGDVIGVETGGEQTHVGETREDENERRRDAERDSAKPRRR